ncbi:MAG: hypothetical protein JOS17DRAFT_539764 [Linnemannia elongata]|nr:MAG: hypothetical protein JOS17DRAFT_539764 [Linnemannia elongata]
MHHLLSCHTHPRPLLITIATIFFSLYSLPFFSSFKRACTKAMIHILSFSSLFLQLCVQGSMCPLSSVFSLALFLCGSFFSCCFLTFRIHNKIADDPGQETPMPQPKARMNSATRLKKK